MEAYELDDKLNDLRKKLEGEFTDSVKVQSPEQLKEQIVQLSKQMEDIGLTKAKDGKLRQLRSDVADINGGYRDAKKHLNQKLQYILLTLQERGSL